LSIFFKNFLDILCVCRQSQREKEAREQQEMQEAAMAAEMERLKLEEKRDSKMRQQIRESRLYKMFLYLLC